MLCKNAVVGQSGGPTCAINATLSGVIRACQEHGSKIDRLYGMRNGIEGLLRENFVDLFSFFDEERLFRLEHTPASALGSCRLKLPSENEDKRMYERIFDILERHSIGYFFYIGGNDSMDTVSKLSSYAIANNHDVRIVGIPKTIDNDLVLTDHAPGYGSACKYIATTVKEIVRDCAVYTQNAVTVVEIMGRDSGWLTASCVLCESGVDLIYLPERAFSPERFISSVKDALCVHPNVVVAVSEGIRYDNGGYVSSSSVKDEFGNCQLCGASRVLCELVKREIGCKARAIELSLPQRCASHLASKTDLDESIRIGRAGARLALSGESGKVPIFKRAQGEYRVDIECVDAKCVANKIKYVPDSFINEQGNGLTKKCADYILPLISGEAYPDYENGLPIHCII